MTSLRPCVSGQVEAMWPAFLPFIERALNPDFTPEHVKGLIQTGLAQLWYTIEDDSTTIGGVIVTSINTYPARKVCQAWVASGTLPPIEWPGLLAMLEQWAAEQGCQAISLYGRPGWERLLRPLHWGVKQVWLEKAINPSTVH